MSLSCSGSIMCVRYFQYSDWIFFYVALRNFLKEVQSSFSLVFLGFVVQSLLFVYHVFMSLLIQGSDHLEEYLKGMNWFMISWML